jgi:nitrite reductase/ring-hydroxylating ferredoxin subunit/uncharacterized membrane protein
MANSPLDRFLAKQNWMDGVGGAIQTGTGAIFKVLGPVGRLLKDVLHGTKPLGHPLHPAVTDIPLGAWALAVVMDIAYLMHRLQPQAADVAIFVGLVGALGAALTGYTDFHETFGHERRAALLHGLTMTVTFVIYIVSFSMRFWGGDGAHTPAIILSFVGFALVATGGYFGGHLVFGVGTMVNRNAFGHPSPKAVVVGNVGDFPEGKPTRVEADEAAVLVTRTGATWAAIGAICSHAGGPLDEGEFGDGVVTCPWHASRFDVRTGKVCQGPATFAQPRYEVLLAGNDVTVRCTDPQ